MDENVDTGSNFRRGDRRGPRLGRQAAEGLRSTRVRDADPVPGLTPSIILGRGRFVSSFSGTDKAVYAATCMPVSPLQLLMVRFDPHCSGHLDAE